MSDQDNLRDRIEDALRDGVGLSWQNKAQAIIDELGLKREWRVVEGFAPSGFIDEWRVVGKWEKQ